MIRTATLLIITAFLLTACGQSNGRTCLGPFCSTPDRG